MGTENFKLFSLVRYEEETGRISSLEMFAVMFNKFPESLLLEYASYFFIPLVMMLINDDSALCRKMAGSAVKLLLMKVKGVPRDELFAIVLNWSQQDKVLCLLLFNIFFCPLMIHLHLFLCKKDS